MKKLNEKQVKQKWTDIKKIIKERQLLAYRVGINLDDWDKYMKSTPSAIEIDRIYNEIQLDRKNKTARIKEGLSKIVGYREAKEFSRKSGVSDTSIRQIIEGKKIMAGYDIINKLELFLNRVMPEFDVSIENPLDIKSFAQEHIGKITSDLNETANRLNRYCFSLTQMARKMEAEKDWQGNTVKPTYNLDFEIKRLIGLKDEIDLFWNVYIEGKIK